MIRRFLGYLSQEVRGLHSAAYILAGAALLSSLLALARDRLLAHTFGAGIELDIYYAAFRIPDLIFVATGALVSVYILIPELTRRAEDDQHRYLDTILAGFSLFAIVISLGAAYLAPQILVSLYPKLVSAGKLDLLVSLTRIMLLQPILLGLSNIFAAVTQMRGRYTLYAMSPLLYNLGIILGVTTFYPVYGLSGLAWGVVIGAFLHAAVQIPSVARDGFLQRLPAIYAWRDLFETVSVSFPRALTLSMTQLAFLGLTSLAAFLTPGSIAIFMFAYNLQAVPLAIVGASYSVAAFPTLSAALVNGEREHFLDCVALAARYVLFWSIPITALIVVLRAYAVRAVLGTGAFDWTDTRLTAAVLALLTISLAAQGLTLLIVRAYYAAGRTFVPFLISAGAALSTVLLSFSMLEAFDNPLLFWATRALLRVEDVPGSGVLALGIGFAIASVVSTIVLLVHFEYRYRGFFRRIQRTLGESISAAMGAGLAAYATLYLIGQIDVGTTTGSIIYKGFTAGGAGAIVAGFCYALLGSKEFGELAASLRARAPEVTLPFGLGARVTVASSAEDQPQQ
jgi:putative peptidoglycan lipid II flippase